MTPARPIRVLAIDHTAGVPPFRRKFTAIAAHDDISLTVLAPGRWIENYRVVEAVPDEGSAYSFRTGNVGWPGYENRAFFRSGLGPAIRDVRPDVLHLWEEPYSVITFQALLLASIWAPSAQSMFFSSDNLSRDFRYSYRPSAFYAAVERFAHRRCAMGTAVSEEVAQVLRAKGFSKRIEVVPHGLDLADFPSTARESPGSGHRPVIGFMGRLLHQKGVDLLLQAVASLQDVDPRLVVVGGGPDRERFERMAHDLGIQDRTEFAPMARHDEVASFLSRIDILVLPSRTTPKWKEQFGRVLIEGMASECVVVGSSSGSIPEVLGDAGMVFSEGDAAALSAALRRALKDPDLAMRLRRCGRARVRERYTWTVVAERVVALYRELTSSAPRE